MKNPKTSPCLSLAQEKEVRGYLIRRLPLGAYIKAAQSLQSLPDTVLEALFPGEDAKSALLKLRHLTPETAVGAIARGLTALPTPLLKVCALLTGVPEHALRDDPEIGADGLMEMLEAVVEVNHLGNFTKAVWALSARLCLPRTTGCSA